MHQCVNIIGLNKWNVTKILLFINDQKIIIVDNIIILEFLYKDNFCTKIMSQHTVILYTRLIVATLHSAHDTRLSYVFNFVQATHKSSIKQIGLILLSRKVRLGASLTFSDIGRLTGYCASVCAYIYILIYYMILNVVGLLII